MNLSVIVLHNDNNLWQSWSKSLNLTVWLLTHLCVSFLNLLSILTLQIIYDLHFFPPFLFLVVLTYSQRSSVTSTSMAIPSSSLLLACPCSCCGSFTLLSQVPEVTWLAGGDDTHSVLQQQRENGVRTYASSATAIWFGSCRWLAA